MFYTSDPLISLLHHTFQGCSLIVVSLQFLSEGSSLILVSLQFLSEGSSLILVSLQFLSEDSSLILVSLQFLSEDSSLIFLCLQLLGQRLELQPTALGQLKNMHIAWAIFILPQDMAFQHYGSYHFYVKSC